MARIDDYRESFRLAAIELAKVDLRRHAERAGADIVVEEDGEVRLRLTFLGSPYLVRVSDRVDVLKEGQEGEVPLPEKIILCHYLLYASGEPATGQPITFRQIPDGQFYFDAFQRRTRDPFLAVFGRNAELFRDCAQELGAMAIESGDVGLAFQVLPHISIQLVLWQGDDELPPEAGVLFDANIQSYLAVEDIAVLSGLLVYRLMGIASTRRAAGQ